MKTLLKKLFIDHWQRKLLAVILSMIIWVVVNHSMTSTKILSNISVKVINIPKGKTIEGLQPSGVLNKKIRLTITGNKNVLDDLTGNDLEVIIDAKDKEDEWIASISKKNLICFNPDIDIRQDVSKVTHPDFIIRLTNQVTEKIPIIITHPIGEPPKNFQFIDIYPYQLHITVSGPESLIKKLKSKELKLTFNLDKITQEELSRIMEQQKSQDEVSYYVPESWKTISIPSLSDTPLTIDDPAAKNLHIDFAKKELILLDAPLPVSVFYPVKYSSTLNPDTFSLATNELIQQKNGIKLITEPLFVKGVSRLFVEAVKEMIQLIIAVAPKNSSDGSSWNIDFISPVESENLYVSAILGKDEMNLQEEYLRNRFRSYMNNFRLYTSDNKKLNLNIELQANTISITRSKTE